MTKVKRFFIVVVCFYVPIQAGYFIADKYLNHTKPFWEEWLWAIIGIGFSLCIVVGVIAAILRIIEYIDTGE